MTAINANGSRFPDGHRARSRRSSTTRPRPSIPTAPRHALGGRVTWLQRRVVRRRAAAEYARRRRSWHVCACREGDLRPAGRSGRGRDGQQHDGPPAVRGPDHPESRHGRSVHRHDSVPRRAWPRRRRRRPTAAELRAANGQSAHGDAPPSIVNPNFTGFASFSSGGPRTGDSGLKPDITAPGVSIFSTGVGTGNGARSISGTSMASPHVAGVAALVAAGSPGLERRGHQGRDREHRRSVAVRWTGPRFARAVPVPDSSSRPTRR